MSVLFLMPTWKASSEVFLQRMIEELKDDLGCIAAWDTEGDVFWHGDIPAVSLTTPQWTSSEKALLYLKLLSRRMSTNDVLSRTISKYHISKVFCHFADFALLFSTVWERIGLPLYIHFHGYDATFDLRHHEAPEVPFHSNDYLEQLIRMSNRATFIANSFFTRDLLVKAGIPNHRIIVKYLGVPLPGDSKLHSSKKIITILHIGRLVDFKSPDRTILAFEHACKNGLDGELIIAGDGQLRMTCELLRVRSPFRHKIKILGAVDAETVSRLLFEADIFTQHNIKGELSSQEECFGVSIVEAMAAGLPVVGTRSGSVIETVLDGETGFLVEPGDVEGQAGGFLRLAADPSLRSRFGEAGRCRVKSCFSIDIEKINLRSILGL